MTRFSYGLLLIGVGGLLLFVPNFWVSALGGGMLGAGIVNGIVGAWRGE